MFYEGFINISCSKKMKSGKPLKYSGDPNTRYENTGTIWLLEKSMSVNRMATAIRKPDMVSSFRTIEQPFYFLGIQKLDLTFFTASLDCFIQKNFIYDSYI
jgi:hypothetical protein